MKKMIGILIGCVAMFALAFTPSKKVKSKIAYQNVQTVADLEEQEIFSFSIISDNHGASPMDNIQMARMNKWISDSDDAFVLGVGDHLNKKGSNEFLSYMLRNNWWKNNFYPTIADAENEFFGKSQSDWGKGSKLLDLLGFDKKENVCMNNNGSEYYAQISVKDITVHYIVLHFPDNPADLSIAFPESSKKYLIQTLKEIKKGAKDIIIVSAHSMYGSWIDYLNPEQQKIVLAKCDLLLAGTTHYFERRVLDGYENAGPLMISCGSVNNARWGCNNGFVQVHVMSNPLSLVVQYINTDEQYNKLQSAPFAFVKYINAEVYPLEFQSLSPAQMIAKAN